MAESKAFQRGVFAGMLVMIGAIAGHWLITPLRHPDAAQWHQVAVLVQLVGGFGGAVWLAWRHGRSNARRHQEAARER
jgi:threonine/homoserine/homoserine lactone efflux protein